MGEGVEEFFIISGSLGGSILRQRFHIKIATSIYFVSQKVHLGFP